MPLLFVIAGALLLAWPALLNQYPIVFSDTHAFLVQGGEPQMVWDKPFVYGPLITLLHQRITLWLPLAAQCLLVSHLLWLTRAAFAPPTWYFHLALCAALAAVSAAPWVASLLMPDILAPAAVLTLFLLAYAPLSRPMRAWLALMATVAIASHLSHLPLALALTILALLLRGRRAVLIPLPAALALLMATNVVGHGRWAISPYGSIFALARLVSDGPAQAVLARECPRPPDERPAWKLCASQGRFPADSDDFLWKEWGPVWSNGGPIALAPEAAAIFRATLRQEPAAVLAGAIANTATQLTRTAIGDTLGSDWLETSITGSLNAYFPPAEMARFRAALQSNDRLRGWATPLNPIHLAALLAGLAATAWLAWRRNSLAAMVLLALVANAAATGALSRPHDRYQARIAWLVLVPMAVTIGSRAAAGSGAPPRMSSR